MTTWLLRCHIAGRHGFQRLVAEVGLIMWYGAWLGNVTVIKVIADWYQLLEVCAIFSTLIGDLDGIYDQAFTMTDVH